MTDAPQRRDSDVTHRLDKQDAVLEDLRTMLVEHKTMHSVTDPALLELINILRGAKFLKQFVIWTAAAIGGLYAFASTAWDHIKFIK
jgi:hypothetical protein